MYVTIFPPFLSVLPVPKLTFSTLKSDRKLGFTLTKPFCSGRDSKFSYG